MGISVEAVFENGVLKPSQSLPCKEGERVRIEVSRSDPAAGPPGLERQQALKRLLSQNLPVADWEAMEREIIHGTLE